jgi:hypothetical protein
MVDSVISATTRQFKILTLLTAQIEAVTPENGYAYDLTGRVFRGRVIFGKDDPIPMVSILEAPRPGIQTPADENKVARLTSWELLIQGWVLDDKVNPLDPVYPLKGSVERQLGRVFAQNPQTGQGLYPEYKLFGTLASMVVGPGVCRPPDAQLSSKAFFWLPVTVQYLEDLSAPFV